MSQASSEQAPRCRQCGDELGEVYSVHRCSTPGSSATNLAGPILTHEDMIQIAAVAHHQLQGALQLVRIASAQASKLPPDGHPDTPAVAEGLSALALALEEVLG